MYVGTDIIGICLDVIKPEHREFVREKVNQYHDVLELSAEQIQDTTNETQKTEENLDTGEKVRVDALNQAANA